MAWRMGLPLQTLALCERAQGCGRDGRFEDAMVLLREATLVRQSNRPWTYADVQGTTGELLRDQGDLDAAITAYTAALDCYERVALLDSLPTSE